MKNNASFAVILIYITQSMPSLYTLNYVIKMSVKNGAL